MELWVLVVFLTCVFLMGGGSRSDISSLVILRPLAILVCAWAYTRLDVGTVRRWRGLLAFAAAMFALPVIHLIPLPPSLWQSLPGHELVVRIDAAIGEPHGWRPLSLSPLDTWNALFALFLPMAALLLTISLPKADHPRLLLALLLLATVSAVLGGLQALRPGATALHFYRIDNPNASDGLFANRNHQAVLLACLVPIAAIVAVTRSAHRYHRFGYIGAVVGLTLPLLLVTGSRAGLITGTLATFSLLGLIPTSSRSSRNVFQRHDTKILVSAAAVLLAGVLAVSQRTEAFQRLFASTPAEESRLSIWRPILSMIERFFPFGSGVGSFVSTYQIYEPTTILSATYRNHAHNEPLEILMTAGLPGLILLAIAVMTWGRYTWLWFRRAPSTNEVLYGRLGSVIVFLLAVASLVDYPARVPSMACLLTIAGIWMIARSDPADSVAEPSVS